MITYWGLKTEFEEQKRMREVCQSILATLPEENLICKRQGDKYHMYLSLKKDGRCCQKSISQRGEGKALINLLKYKKCLIQIERQLEKNVRSLEKCLTHYQEINLLRLEEHLSPAIRSGGFDFLFYDRNQPGVSLFREQYRIRKSGDCAGAEKFSQQEDSFPPVRAEGTSQEQPYRAEGLKINTGLGFSVRSKSELLICMKLRDAGLDFRYEQPRRVGAQVFYPDFTIDLGNGTQVLWEHFGMLDDSAYSEHMKCKMMQYVSSGYLPGKHIFFTYENLGEPLDVMDIEGIVRSLSAASAATHRDSMN